MPDKLTEINADTDVRQVKLFARVWLIGQMIGPDLLTKTHAEAGKDIDKAFTLAEEIINRSLKEEESF